jgi:hypothetical protein
MVDYIEYDGIKFYYSGSGYYGHPKVGSLHCYIYTEYYGTIPKGMVVHHKDGNRKNNDISNLVLMTRGEHSKLHNKDKTKPPRTEEHKRKLSEAHKGRIPVFYKGSKHTEETKIKMSNAKKGKFTHEITQEMRDDVLGGISRRKFATKYGCVNPWIRIKEGI